jgi:hypothetical protein
MGEKSAEAHCDGAKSISSRSWRSAFAVSALRR